MLETLEARLATLTDPDALVALASQIDQLGVALAEELVRARSDAARAQALKVQLVRVPALYVRALVAAAEKFDDRGSPRRAAYVLLQALRKAFAPDTFGMVAEALAFTLEAHAQVDVAARVRALLSAPAPHAARLAELDAVQDAIEWSALDDEDLTRQS